ncbi:efflux RND transporter periplasmic adaptor subunit [Spirochaeta isovalerica]|uniref:HlyD family secretion protein n=1 Tax=Spirochaeta isovalerica TaxID=150 RepID=A0A841R7A1_9SPIO|nr:efflux RND transporter periplasmic adaptor subunit [Spirochaeta isovalerica]MBB6478859.1 HlyD family secretion protein [Spirochaeta isovalerica]
MAELRKIIQVEESSPLISGSRKKKAYISAAVVALLVASVLVAIFLNTKSSIKQIGDYTVAEVTTGSFTTSTEASGTVVLPTQVSIVNMETGYAKEIYVNEGDSITESTILAVLDVPDLEEQRDDLMDELETQQIALEEIKLSGEYTLRELDLSLQRIEEDIAEGEEAVQTEKELMELKSSRASDYEEAVDALQSLYEQKEDLLLSKEKTERSNELSLKKQEAQIASLEVSLKRVQKDIEDASITSPIAGDILSLEENLMVPGSLIEQNTALFTVADTRDVYIDLEVYEQYSSYLEVGGSVELVISNNVVEGEIKQIGRVASMSSDGLAATVTVRVRPVGVSELTPGASAVADIPLGTTEDALLLPRGSYLTTGSQKYVYRIDGSRAYKTTVVFGEIQGSQVEVLSGLEAGDQIIISSYQDYIDQDVIEVN